MPGRTAILCACMLAASLCAGDPAPGPRAPLPPWLDASASMSGASADRSGASFLASDPTSPGDDFWWDGFALPELDGAVWCAVVFDGSIVIGGAFTQVGGIQARNIARWDGTRWSTVGEGLERPVASLAVYRGELIAAGYFSRTGGETPPGIARWDGTAWRPLGGGLWNGDPPTPAISSALLVRGDVLYVGGLFDHAGSVAARNVASWNGAEWSALGAGVDGEAVSLAVHGDELYVGGWFQHAGGLPAMGIARWNGQVWADVGGGISSSAGYGAVFDMVSYQGTLIATGFFESAGSVVADHIASWNGTEWQPLGASPSYLGSSVAVRGGKLYAGGYYLQVWDGSSWSSPPVSVTGSLDCLLDTPQGLLAGGSFTARSFDGSIVGAGIGLLDEAWLDPIPWSDRMRGLKDQSSVNVRSLASYRGSLVAAGVFSYTGSAGGRVRVGSLATWDGAKWSALSTPLGAYAECLLPDGENLYVGGAFWSRGPVPVVRFDGVSWANLDTLSLYPEDLIIYQGMLYAAGGRWSLNSPKLAGVHQWDGASWQSIGVAEQLDDFPRVYSLVEYQGRLVAAGEFDRIAGVPARCMAAWDGSAWTAMDSGLDADYVTTLGVCDGTLYAGGRLRDERDRFVGLVRWDGSAWQPVPGYARPFHSEALECSGGRLFVGGDMYDEPFNRRGIIVWDGERWSTLGSGVNGLVFSLLIRDGQLYVGGNFTRAGSHSSFGIARWDLRSEARATEAALTGSVPNPFQTSTTIAYRLAAPGRVKVSVYDLRGAKVAVLEDGQRPGGTHFAVWNGRDRDGRIAPPGIYLVQLDLGGHVESRRVARLR